jgi:hypothetical protein
MKEEIENEKLIEAFAKDRTTGLPEEAYEQEDQTITGFSRGGGAAVTGTKFEGVF